MSRPDLRYLASLVQPIKEGDMNAFAELFIATCEKQYSFAMSLLGKEFDARSVLEDTYITLIKTISNLRDDSIITSYLTRTTFINCVKKRAMHSENACRDPQAEQVNCYGKYYSIRRILELPYSESQSLLLVCYCGYKVREAADILELTSGAVRHYISNARQRLKSVPAGGEYTR